MDLFKTKADADNNDYAAWDMGYLKDNTTAASAVNNYSYTVTSTASSSLGAVTEGSSIEFKITRTKNSGDDLSTTICRNRGCSAIDGVDYRNFRALRLSLKRMKPKKQ